MHIPDGFLNATTSIGTGVLAVGGVGTALRQTGRSIATDRRIPLAGISAAVIFVLQMLNFPVALGTSGHLLGGTLAAVLLGPWLGVLVLTVVVGVQALVFADGGVSALGSNLLNMAIITVLVGWAVYRLVRTITPARRWAVTLAVFLAGVASVVASAVAFSIEYAVGGQGGAPLGALVAAMTSVHLVIGLGEGLISALIVGGLLATRPDVVVGAADLDGGPRLGDRGAIVGGLALLAALVFGIAPIASPNPDGLERVALDLGFSETATSHQLADSPLAGYVVDGLGTSALAIGAAGLVGAGGVGLAAWFLTRLARRPARR